MTARPVIISPTSGVALCAVVIAALSTLLLEAWRTPQKPTEVRFALSPQECNTRCQTDQTDCIIACDGQVKCETDCTKVGLDCVERCTRPAADGGGLP